METSFREEENHWEAVRQELVYRQEELWGKSQNYQAEAVSFQKYMVDNRGTIDPHEMFSNQRLQSQQQLSEDIVEKQARKVTAMLQDPYFSRIDFQYAGESEVEPLYIGRFSFVGEGGESVIYDWRAPISSLFYEYDVGPAGFAAPQGLIEGVITNKRQLKFAQGELVKVFDSKSNVYDEVLQEVLASQTGGGMTNVVQSIQKEQNRIIRSDSRRDLIIQGVAGSGKTTIALHRIAFLLYKNRETLQSEDILILSPNRVFGSYIADVLPELGEAPVKESSVEDFARSALLQRQRFASKSEENEKILENSDTAFLMRTRYKYSRRIVEDLEEFLMELETELFQPEDLELEGVVFSKAYLFKRFAGYRRWPVMARLAGIAEDILEDLNRKAFRDKRRSTLSQVHRRLVKMLRYRDCVAVYRIFLREYLPDDPACRFEYGDLFPLLRIQNFFEKGEEFGKIKVVVMDEMQDYAPLQLAVLKQMFPGPKLLLGDFSQIVNGLNELTLQELSKIFPDAEVIRLTKSYRSTYEIMTFAKEIIQDRTIEAMQRKGSWPRVISGGNRQAQLRQLVRVLREGSYQTIGVIAKTQKLAEEWFAFLSEEFPARVQLVDERSRAIDGGITVCSVAYAKGLEFELVVGVDVETFRETPNLLFILCTRALHELILIGKDACDEQSTDDSVCG